MNTQSSSKSWIWIIVIIAVAGGGYFWWSGSASSSTGSLEVNTNDATGVLGSQVLGLLNQVRSLNIDTKLFTNKAYLSLHDFSITIPPQTIGRANPFAPFAGDPNLLQKK